MPDDPPLQPTSSAPDPAIAAAAAETWQKDKSRSVLVVTTENADALSDPSKLTPADFDAIVSKADAEAKAVAEDVEKSKSVTVHKLGAFRSVATKGAFAGVLPTVEDPTP